ALRLQREHGAHVHCTPACRRIAQTRVLHRVGLRRLPALDAPTGRQVAVHEVVRGRLVGDEIRLDAATYDLRQQLGRIAEQADRYGLALRRIAGNARQRVVEIAGLLVEIARAQACIDPALLTFDVERASAGERCRERLRA